MGVIRKLCRFGVEFKHDNVPPQTECTLFVRVDRAFRPAELLVATVKGFVINAVLVDGDDALNGTGPVPAERYGEGAVAFGRCIPMRVAQVGSEIMLIVTNKSHDALPFVARIEGFSVRP